jgi:septal ring factor EnvC (AmiA/AmiB activator)
MNQPNHSDLYTGLGEIRGTITGMDQRLNKIEQVLERIDDRLSAMEAKENQRKGVIATLMVFSGFIGGLVAKFGAFIFGGGHS